MGEYFQIIADKEATEEEAPILAEAIRDWLLSEGIIGSDMTDNVLGSDLGYPPGPNHEKAVEDKVPDLWTNGLDIITRRSVFYPIPGEVELTCARCGRHFHPEDEWGDAISEWYDRTGPGMLSCPYCGMESPITEWQPDPPWALGYLGFEFWNWPPLRTSFVEEVSERLGHKVVVVEGKL